MENITVNMDSQTKKVLIEKNGGIKLIKSGCRKALSEIGNIIKKKISEGIKSPPKTGKYYKYKSRKKRASINLELAEYPANRSGKLRRSINYKVNNKAQVIIGLSAEYAKYLEEGTGYVKKRKLSEDTVKEVVEKKADMIKDKISKMKKRKLLEYTVKEVVEKKADMIKDIIRKNIDASLKK